MLSDLTTLVHQNVTKLLLSSVSMVALLFSASEPGQLMPVDPAYLYQDTAGTTPVTATGQSVALWLDRSGRGNNDTQATVGSRPIYGKHPANGYRNMLAASDALSTQSVTVTAIAHTLAFTGTGTITLSGTSTAGPLVGTGASNRVSLTFTPTAGTLTLTVSGSVTLAQLETGSTATTYQRTGATSGLSWPAPASYDITEVGQSDLHYLHYNGVSSFMVSPTITPGIDKAQVFVGVRKLSDAAAMVIVEHSSSSDANNGTFGILGRNGGGLGIDCYGALVRGVAQSSRAPNGYASPITNVLNVNIDLASSTVIGSASWRINGTSPLSISSSGIPPGGGNFLAYPLYTGRRAGTTFPFSGLLYSKIVRFGPTLTADQIAATERWTAQRTGVSL
jgi:hypothetical protein